MSAHIDAAMAGVAGVAGVDAHAVTASRVQERGRPVRMVMRQPDM